MTYQEFNRRCAELLGIFYSESTDIFVIWPDESMPREFNPRFDANDRNAILENLGVDVDCYGDPKLWTCEILSPRRSIKSQDLSMEAAQNKAIEAYLASTSEGEA